MKYKVGSQDFSGSFTGKIKNSVPRGQGTMIFDDRRKFVGLWKNGQPEGQGQMTYTDGTAYFGAWKKGRMHGPGTIRFTDGTYEEGRWKQLLKKRTGTWIGSYLKINENKGVLLYPFAPGPICYSGSFK